MQGLLYQIHDTKKYFSTYFTCPNRTFGCYFQFGDRQDLERHLLICVDPKILREQSESDAIEYGRCFNMLDNLLKRRVLSNTPKYDNHICYDVESLMKPLESGTAHTDHLFEHRLVSVAANAYINNVHTTKCWVVNDDSADEQKRIVNEFLVFVLEQEEMVEHDAELVDTIATYETNVEHEQAKLQEKDLHKSPKLSQLQKELRFLNTYMELPLIGFNSSRYDMKLLMKFVISALEEQDECLNLSLLKKGAGYFHVRTGSLVWKDLLNFTPPMKLEAYLKMWQTEGEKLCFPYELFSSISSLEACVKFPDLDSFTTSLGNEVDIQLYTKCNVLFEERMSLPEDDPKKWYNFKDYLIYYNESDVYPTSLAIIKMMTLLEEQFGVNPLITYGLPSFGFAAMMKCYKESCPSVISFPNTFNHLSKLFRESIIGGIVNPICRHVTTDQNEHAAPAAKANEDCVSFKLIQFWDINAMYPAGYKNNQPVGLGFEWTNNDGIFKKKLIRNSNASLEAIQWIDSLRHDPKLIDKCGKRQAIRTAWFGSEINVGTTDRPIYVDGHCVVDGKVYVYEYDGCPFHFCTEDGCDIEYIASPEKITDDIARRKFLHKNFHLQYITSCEWYKQRKSVTNPGISPLLHHTSVTEETLLQHIINGTVFGFVVIDLFPTKAAKKFELANWGPIFERQTVEFDMLPVWMRVNADEKQYPKQILCQTFHAEKYFCSVNLARFYVEHGYKITKLHHFVEFEGKPVLEEFYQKVYDMRVQATEDSNKCLQAAAKNTANSRKLLFI